MSPGRDRVINMNSPQEKGTAKGASPWYPQRSHQKRNIDIRAPSAGPLVGMWGLAPDRTGLGRLSRLRPEIVGRPQLVSMNFRIETWWLGSGAMGPPS